MYPIHDIRNDFPILSQKIHSHNFIYLDSAATTQKPQCVIDAVVDMYSKYNSNIHRGIHSLSQKSTELYENAREIVQHFIHAPHKNEIIFTKGATESINLVASSFGKTYLTEGDEIIVSAMEHHSNLVPWQIICEKKQAVLKYIPFFENGELDIEAFERLLSKKTKFVSIIHISNSLGTVNPIKRIIEKAHAYNVPVLVDGSQSIQHEPIDVQDLGCDFFVFSGHKIYAPNGIGVLWGKEAWLEKLPPYQSGGDMIETVTLEKTIYNDIPFKFEAGTSNYVAAHALGVALNYMQKIGMQAVMLHENNLMKHATHALEAIDEIRIIGTASQKAGAISFLLQGAHPADVGMILDKRGIAIRTGTHCTEPVMQFYGIPGTARISFGMYNTIQEIDECVAVLHKIVQMFA